MDRIETIILFLGGFLCTQFISVTGDCTRPIINANDVEIYPNKTSYSLYDVITVTCIGNTTLTGISPMVTCDETNDWSRDFSFIACLDDCSLASLDDNIRVTSQNTSIEGVLVEHGTTVDFECNGIVSGHPSSTCSDGSWSSPLPVCILDTVPTTSSQMPSTPSTRPTSANMTSSSNPTTLVTVDDKTSVPVNLTTQVADVTQSGNATSPHFTTNILGKTDVMTTVEGGITQRETMKTTEFKVTTDPEVQTTSPELADMSTTMSTGMMTTETMMTSGDQKTTQYDLTTSKSQFTEPAFSTANFNGTVKQTNILVTDPGFTTTTYDHRTTEIDVTTKPVAATTGLVGVTYIDSTTSKSFTTMGDGKVTEYDQNTVPTTTSFVKGTDYYSTTQYKEKSTVPLDTTEKEKNTTTMLTRTTMQTDTLTDGEVSTQTTPDIIEITDLTTKLELTTMPTSSYGYMTTQEDTNQPTEMASTSVQDVTSPTDNYSTVELGGKSTIGRHTTNGSDFTTVQLQTVIQTELVTDMLLTTRMTTEYQPKVTSKQTEKSGMTSEQETGITDDTEMTTLQQLTKISTTGGKDMTTKEDLIKTSYTTQSTETENTSGYDITTSRDYSSTVQSGKSTMEAGKTDGTTTTTMRPQTMIQTDYVTYVTDETSPTKVTTDTATRMTSMLATTPQIIGKTDDEGTTKLEQATSQSITSTSERGMTTIQDSLTTPDTTQPNTSGRDVTSPKVTNITTAVDDTTLETGVASTLGDDVTTYLSTEVARVTTPSLMVMTDVSDSTENGTSQTSATDTTTKVDLKTETSTTKEEDLKTVITDEPTTETEIITEEAPSTTVVLRATTGTYEELTTTIKSSDKITTSSEKLTSSEKVTSSSANATHSDTTVTAGVSRMTSASPVVTDEPKDPSTSSEKTSTPSTSSEKTSISTSTKITSMSSVDISTSGELRTTSKTTTSRATCEDISCMMPSAIKCDNSGQLPVCVCREGYFRKSSEQTCSEAESFQNSIRVVSQTNGQTVVYDRQLEDSTSERFISLAEDICTAIDAIFENYNTAMRFYLGCKVFRFRQGSVIVEFMTYFTTSSSITEDQNKQIIQLSLEANDALPSSNLIIDPESITSQPTNECELGLDDCDYWNAICTDEGASGFSCQCKDGYRDDSPESLPGRTCTEVSVNAALLVSILLIIFLVILVLVLAYILPTFRRLKVPKGHQAYRSPVHVDSEIALYAMGEVIPEP